MTNEIKYPVAFLKLDEGDPESKLKDRKGRPAAFMIEQVDGDRFCFPSHGDGERFMAIHGLTPVGDAEMERAREA